jgi:Mrp family chromosome partitioning ATPase
MNPVQRPDSFEAAVYVGVLRRRWLTIVILTVIGLVGALGYAIVAPKTYTGTADVNVTPTGANDNNAVAGARTSGPVNLDTEAQIVMSTTVAAIAGKILHTTSTLTAWDLVQDVSVTVPPNSSVLTINCDWNTANGSSDCANAFAKAYLENRTATATSTIDSQITKVQSQVTALQQQASSLSTKVSSLPANSSAKLSAETDLTSTQNQLHTLTGEIATLNGQAANDSGGSIITLATPPGKPSKPKKALVLPSGAVAGLLLGLIFAFVRDQRDKRVHATKDVERLADVPVILDLPKKAFAQQLSLASPRSKTGQAFTELAHAVAASLGEGSHVVLVAGTTSGPGGSVIAANLAATMARTHSEVVLVCANMEDGVAAEMLGVEQGRGLAEVLAGRATVRDVAHGPAGIPGLWVITPGADTSLTVYNLQHDRAQALTSQLRRDARYVIIDVQATDEGTDTFALAEFADAAILVVEIPRTTRPGIAECIRRLRQLRTPVLGAAVLSAVSPRTVVRPPRPGQARLGSGEDGEHDEAVGRRPGEFSALSSKSAPSGSNGGRAGRLRTEGRGDPAGRIPGS